MLFHRATFERHDSFPRVQVFSLGCDEFGPIHRWWEKQAGVAQWSQEGSVSGRGGQDLQVPAGPTGSWWLGLGPGTPSSVSGTGRAEELAAGETSFTVLRDLEQQCGAPAFCAPNRGEGGELGPSPITSTHLF